jgi:hypothetical protein
MLKEMKENYRILGYETFESYLGAPEVSIGRSTAYSLIEIYNKLIEEKGLEIKLLSEIDYSKLLKIIPMSNQSDFGEWLEKAKTLSRSDLIDEIKELKGEEVCQHLEMETINRCLKCKKLL